MRTISNCISFYFFSFNILVLLNYRNLISNFKVIIFRCGRLHSDKEHPNCQFGPGLVKYYPNVDTGFYPKSPPIKIDLRDQLARVPEHEFLTADAKVLRSSATIIYQIIHPVKFVLNVRDALGSTILLCSSIMLDIGSKNNFDDLFQNKKEIAKQILVLFYKWFFNSFS